MRTDTHDGDCERFGSRTLCAKTKAMNEAPAFEFSAHEKFLNRTDDLRRLQRWWEDDDRDVIAMLGRRRVGKSWLFREFAHGKPAIVLVAERLVEAGQMQRFATELTPIVGIRPSIDSVPDLFRTLLQVSAEQKVLAVIDEFPYLLPEGSARDVVLSQIQAVLEERDASRLKLVLCGSYIGQMTQLLSGPLRGRLTPLPVAPLSFREAQPFFAGALTAEERIERYAVSGGMSAYLVPLGAPEALDELVSHEVLSPRASLFNDPREILDEELRRQTTTYYSILDVLSRGRKMAIGEIAAAVGRKSTDLSGYLERLEAMHLVEALQPVDAKPKDKSRRYRLADPFMRFWFRFVAPHQEALRAGLPPAALWAAEIAPMLADHCSPTFEQLCQRWALRGHGQAAPTSVGSWWGSALHDLRRSKVRSSEEIDVVGLSAKRAVLVGECKWTNAPMPYAVLDELERYKLPALEQSGVTLHRERQIVLFARSGFDEPLQRAAARRSELHLVSATALAHDLVA